MKVVRWVLSALVAAAIGYPAWLYFTARLAQESSSGAAYRSAYAADIVVVAMTLAATIGVLVALIHDRGRFRNILLIATFLLLGGSILSFRELAFATSLDGKLVEAGMFSPFRSERDIGLSERICFRAGTFAVEIHNPDTQRSAKIFRGVWPWTFDQKELDRLFRSKAC